MLPIKRQEGVYMHKVRTNISNRAMDAIEIEAKRGAEFTSYQQNVSGLCTEAKSISKMSFKNFKLFLTNTLKLIEQDIYLSPIAAKEELLKQLPEMINKFFQRNQKNSRMTAQVISLLAKRNIEFKFDQPWVMAEKESLLKDIFKRLVELFCHQLDDSESEEKNNNRLIKRIALVIRALSRWDFPPENYVLEHLLTQLEWRFSPDNLPSPATSFALLDGVTRMHGRIRINRQRSELFAQLAQRALPLLFKEITPLVMFSAKYLTMFRIARLKLLLPQPNVVCYGRFFMGFLRDPENRRKTWTIPEIESAIPKDVFRYQELMAALNLKEEQLFDDPECKSWHGESSFEIKQSYFMVDSFIKHANYLHNNHHLKGLQYLITGYSAAMLVYIQGGYETYPFENIRDYLQLLRNCVLEMEARQINAAVKQLGEEMLRPIHFDNMDSQSALDLLWINLVLTEMSEDRSIAYSREEQKQLFRKIKFEAMNGSQARALFTIQAFKWHGGVPFDPKLTQQMHNCTKQFLTDVKHFKEKQDVYQKILTALPQHQQRFLKTNFTCYQTGRVIDIVYYHRDQKIKIAIHLDGLSHFDLVTGLPTPQTRFRNRCLAKGGWTSLDIDMTHSINWDRMLKELRQSLSRDPEAKLAAAGVKSAPSMPLQIGRPQSLMWRVKPPAGDSQGSAEFQARPVLQLD